MTVSCAKQEKNANDHTNTVPKEWYDSTKEAKTEKPPIAEPEEADPLDDPQQIAALEKTVDTIFQANNEALEDGDAEAQTFLAPMALQEPPKNKPKDWVPWRAEYFMTDLSLTASGALGVLALRGQATVRAFWRRQGPETKKSPTKNEPKDLSGLVAGNDGDKPSDDQEPIVHITAMSSPTDLLNQIEPAIRAAVATGKLKDTLDLRKNLLIAAREFQAVASAIPTDSSDHPWWVSRFRLDLMIDAAGRVEPVGMVGGEARFRFEWHRIQCKGPCPTHNTPLTVEQQNLKSQLKAFIQATATDIEHAFADHADFGFKAHQIRMGIGITAKGNIGVVKGAAGIVGQIYFTRDVKRPVVRPRTADLVVTEEPLYIIEKQPSVEHLNWATKNGVTFDTAVSPMGLGFEEAVYKVDRQVFRKGLKKAAKIGRFFARRAASVRPGAWKIYELRTAFDTSIGGALDMVTLAGTTTAQISMFNENF